MTARHSVAIGAAVVTVLLPGATIAGQQTRTPSGAPEAKAAYRQPRTPDGQPDIRGFWHIVPFGTPRISR